MAAQPAEPGGDFLDLGLVGLLAADEIRAVAAMIFTARDISRSRGLQSPGPRPDQHCLAPSGKLKRQPHPRIRVGVRIDVHQDGRVPHPRSQMLGRNAPYVRAAEPPCHAPGARPR